LIIELSNNYKFYNFDKKILMEILLLTQEIWRFLLAMSNRKSSCLHGVELPFHGQGFVRTSCVDWLVPRFFYNNFYIMKNEKSILDPEVPKLQEKVVILEKQLAEYQSQKASLEKQINEYNHKFYSSVGHLISEVNRLKMELLREEALHDQRKQQGYSEAKKEYEEFDSQYQQIASKDIKTLNQTEQKLLKSNFRKASLLCHPDSVSNEFKNEASRIFAELKDAYDTNDLKTVNSILDRLENSIKFPKKSETVTDRYRLSLLIDHLKSEIESVKNEIEAIQNSEVYRHITTIGNWEIYISHIRQQLEKEVSRLKSSL